MAATRKPVSLQGWSTNLLAGLAAFCIYSAMYAFRKPFTAASYEGVRFAGADFKVWAVIIQTIGYTASKFAGISFIGSITREKRARSIIKLILAAWVALFFFGVFPPPWNLLFLAVNGFTLGFIYGLVFAYLEGRRSTELLGAVLAASFIFASGFAQSAGKILLLRTSVSEWWMPWLTGLLFLVPLVVFTWLLDRLPDPDPLDKQARTPRVPMSRRERNQFVKRFLPGLALLVFTYILLTIARDYRSNFAAAIWKETGHGQSAAVFIYSELPATIVVLLITGSLFLIRNNLHAFLINHILIIAGLILAALTTALYTSGLLGTLAWMMLSGAGLYVAYVPFNGMLFERMIAVFRCAGNAGFIIYIADAFGYLGSDAVLLYKSFAAGASSWSGFLVQLIYITACIGTIAIALAAFYFKRQYKLTKQTQFPIAVYG